ncbi:hypothetical protein [Novosphingobium sp.]|uniref:hypothetical protein n=1 Tax=Novosphingobium sp. TaxID=1874826 RepID=UPI00262FF1ED|nr:hypothetical protein [Novosphingobium sp.]
MEVVALFVASRSFPLSSLAGRGRWLQPKVASFPAAAVHLTNVALTGSDGEIASSPVRGHPGQGLCTANSPDPAVSTSYKLEEVVSSRSREHRRTTVMRLKAGLDDSFEFGRGCAATVERIFQNSVKGFAPAETSSVWPERSDQIGCPRSAHALNLSFDFSKYVIHVGCSVFEATDQMLANFTSVKFI